MRFFRSGCCPINTWRGWCANRQLEVNSVVTESSRWSVETTEEGNTSSGCCQISRLHQWAVLSAGIKPQQFCPRRSWYPPGNYGMLTWCWIIDMKSMHYTCRETIYWSSSSGEDRPQRCSKSNTFLPKWALICQVTQRWHLSDKSQ